MSDYVPDDLIDEILCRLPVESLLRFRCVRKKWCCLISSPRIINPHLSRSLSSPPLLLLRHYSTTRRRKHEHEHEHYSVYLDPPSKAQLTFVKKFEVPFKARPGYKFSAVGFCNGLLCLSDDVPGETYFILWNPAIRKALSLPMPPTLSDCRFCHGFGFDPETQDFKVVRIAYEEGTCSGSAVEVYSLSTGLWKSFNSIDIHRQLNQNFVRGPHVCLNGTIYWVSYVKNKGERRSNRLLLFNLSNNTFSEMGLPRALIHVEPNTLTVTLCGEMISVIWENVPCKHYVVWVMNQYGEPESWTEKFVVVFEPKLSALGFRDNGEFMLCNDVGLSSYDPDNEELKHVDIHGERRPVWLSKYVESLVLLDGSGGATTDPPEDA